MYSGSTTLSQILLKKILCFGQVINFLKQTFRFSDANFETEHFLNVLFAYIWLVFGEYKQSAGFIPKFLREGTQKWFRASGLPLCTNESKK